ncbi:MAG TPA: succinate dehydrogenase flavoprotein subunit [Planctomycetota bacterium]|jgi:succinate dehydrogenase / fumarate reductase flavoprotein subunit
MAQQRITIIGGGLAGLMATLRVAEMGVHVDLFSLVPVKRSHSVCAQGGINGAVNTKGEGDSPEIHFIDTIKGGDFLAHQPPVREMCYSAPGIIYLFDRMGVTFNRTSEGLLDFRRFGGTLHSRTAFAGATTGQQLLYALDEQVRRYECEGLVVKHEGWEFLSIIQDETGRCVGSVSQNLVDMSIRSFPADAVCIATGGMGLIFGRTTNSMLNHGSAAAACYEQGAIFGNPEFVQIHPTAIAGGDKLRLMSESARGEGARVWVPKKKGDARPQHEIPQSERWYFLEEKYPTFKNLVPRDIASREIFHVCFDLGMGLKGQNEVYLDLTELTGAKGKAFVQSKLGGILEIYEKFMQEDPYCMPMRIFPAVHYCMNGLWVQYEKDSVTGGLRNDSAFNQMTNIPGLYAAGEADFQYHGANRLGANSLLSCLFGGQVAGPAMVRFARGKKTSATEMPASLFEAAQKREQQKWQGILTMRGTENPFRLHQQLGDMMTRDATIVRHNAALEGVLGKLKEFKERWKKCENCDAGERANQVGPFVRQLWHMLVLSEAIVKGALQRDECRGAHYKPEFVNPLPANSGDPADADWERYFTRYFEDNAKYLKSTLATYTPDGPKITYEEIDTNLMKPKPRDYIGHSTTAWEKVWAAKFEAKKRMQPVLAGAEPDEARVNGT